MIDHRSGIDRFRWFVTCNAAARDTRARFKAARCANRIANLWSRRPLAGLFMYHT
jgi:hypothetical protein